MAASLIVNPAIRLGILHGIELGMTQAKAARNANVSPETVKEWMRRGRGDDHRPDVDGVYASFVEDVERAKAVAIKVLLESIRDAAKAPNGKGWGAAAWLLAKLDPATYGDKIEVRGEIEHRKTYRFEAPVIPVPVKGGPIIEIEANPPSEEGQSDGEDS